MLLLLLLMLMLMLLRLGYRHLGCPSLKNITCVPNNVE